MEIKKKKKKKSRINEKRVQVEDSIFVLFSPKTDKDVQKTY